MTKKILWHPLADILDVKLKSTSWNHDKNANYQIVIILKSGKDLILNVGKVSEIDNKLETVNLIRKFLGMPPQTLHKQSLLKLKLYDNTHEK